MDLLAVDEGPGQLFDEAMYLAGICAYEMGFGEWALRNFERTNNPRKDVYLGALARQQDMTLSEWLIARHREEWLAL